MSKRKKTIITVTILFVAFISASLWLNASNKECILTNSEALGNTYYSMQIITSAFLCVGAVIGIWQYVLTARSERAKIKNEKIQRAINLAEYYKDNILPALTTYEYIFEKTGMKSILGNIDVKRMEQFDSNEWKGILSKRKRDQLRTLMKSDKFIDIVLQFTDANDASKSGDGDKAYQKRKISSEMNNILNNMEYFAMSFTHGTADESVVYQSLHQTYLELVQLFYFNIAMNNKPTEAQYYTNVVELYKIWRKRSLEHRAAMNEKKKESIVPGSRVDDMDT